jgi:hypothetical protein
MELSEKQKKLKTVKKFVSRVKKLDELVKKKALLVALRELNTIN